MNCSKNDLHCSSKVCGQLDLFILLIYVLKVANTFIQQAQIKLIETDSEENNVTDFSFK